MRYVYRKERQTWMLKHYEGMLDHFLNGASNNHGERATEGNSSATVQDDEEVYIGFSLSGNTLKRDTQPPKFVWFSAVHPLTPAATHDPVETPFPAELPSVDKT